MSYIFTLELCNIWQYALLNCVWKYLRYAIFVKFLEAMHFWGMHFLVFLFEVMHFYEICNIPWRYALLRFNFITNLKQCKLEQCNIFWDTYINNSNLKKCNFFVCYATLNNTKLTLHCVILSYETFSGNTWLHSSRYCCNSQSWTSL